LSILYHLVFLPLPEGVYDLKIMVQCGPKQNHRSTGIDEPFSPEFGRRDSLIKGVNIPEIQLLNISFGNWSIPLKFPTANGGSRPWDRPFIFGNGDPEFQWTLKVSGTMLYASPYSSNYRKSGSLNAWAPVLKEGEHLNIHFFEEDDLKKDHILFIDLDLAALSYPFKKKYAKEGLLDSCQLKIVKKLPGEFPEPADSVWIDEFLISGDSMRFMVNFIFNDPIPGYKYRLFVEAGNGTSDPGFYPATQILKKNKKIGTSTAEKISLWPYSTYPTESGLMLPAKKELKELSFTIPSEGLLDEELRLSYYYIANNDFFSQSSFPGRIFLSLFQEQKVKRTREIGR